MARQITSGFEGGQLSSGDSPNSVGTVGTAPTFVTSPVRSGLYALKVTTQGSSFGWSLTGTTTQSFFGRTYMYMQTAAPSVASEVFIVQGLSGATFVRIASITISTGGVPSVLDSTGATVCTSSSALSANTWYRLEISLNMSTGACELLVNGTSVATGTGTLGSHGPARLLVGAGGSSALTNPLYFDDVAFNDSSGTSQTSYAGEGKVVILWPKSDSSNTGFTGGAGGTTNLYDAVNNAPPLGNSTPTNATQLKQTTANTTDNYQPTLGAYTDTLGTATTGGGGGLGASDTVTLVYAFARANAAVGLTTSFSAGVSGVSNPAVTEVTAIPTRSTSITTEPSNTWGTIWTAAVISPTVTLSSSPVIEIRRNTTTAGTLSVDQMGLMTEYVAATGGGGGSTQVIAMMV